MRRQRIRSGFTLSELLVVAGTIAALAGLTLPVNAIIVGQARSVDCRNNLRNLAAWGLAYAAEWRGILPTNTGAKHPNSNNFFHLAGQSRWFNKLDEFRPAHQRGLGLLCRQAKASLRRWDDPGTYQNSYDYSLNNFLGGNRIKGYDPPRISHLSADAFWFSDGGARSLVSPC